MYKYLSENGVYLEGSLLKPSMTVPGADCKKSVKSEVPRPPPPPDPDPPSHRPAPAGRGDDACDDGTGGTARPDTTIFHDFSTE